MARNKPEAAEEDEELPDLKKPTTKPTRRVKDKVDTAVESAEKARKAARNDKDAARVARGPSTAEYGIAYLASELSLEAASVRILLRKHGIKKAENGRYEWARKSEADAIVKQLNKARKSSTKGSDAEAA